MRDFNFLMTLTANGVVVIVTSGFIDKLPPGDLRRESQFVLDEEIQRAVDGCFHQPWGVFTRLFVDFPWGKMPPGMA